MSNNNQIGVVTGKLFLIEYQEKVSENSGKKYGRYKFLMNNVAITCNGGLLDNKLVPGSVVLVTMRVEGRLNTKTGYPEMSAFVLNVKPNADE